MPEIESCPPGTCCRVVLSTHDARYADAGHARGSTRFSSTLFGITAQVNPTARPWPADPA